MMKLVDEICSTGAREVDLRLDNWRGLKKMTICYKELEKKVKFEED